MYGWDLSLVLSSEINEISDNVGDLIKLLFWGFISVDSFNGGNLTSTDSGIVF